jgi:hypothetical protein
MSKNSIKAVPMTTFASTSVSGTYAPIITGGLAQACYLLRIINDTTQDVTISFDGVTDADYILLGTGNNIPAIYGAQPNSYVALFPKGMQIYVKGTAGTGNIYVSGYYQPRGV